MSTVSQKLEGFTFATALDLNMGYYIISLDLDAFKICTIKMPLANRNGRFSRLFPRWSYGILRVCTSLHRWPPLHLKEQPRIPPRKKLEDILRQLRDANLKVNAYNRHSAHLKNAWGTYLVKTKLNLRAIRHRQYLRFNHPKEWNN